MWGRALTFKVPMMSLEFHVAQLVLSISSISQSQYCGRVQQKNTSAKTIKFLLMVPYADPLNRSSLILLSITIFKDTK